jgi:4-amino-4-deoxy-L-arabinose transferase-like glycosyltransferase
MSTLVSERAAVQQSRWPLWVSLIAVAGAFIVRLPGIVEPMGPDQGLYASMAWGMQRGLVLYRDLFEQKPPGLFLTYRLGFALFGSRTASIFWIDYLAGAMSVLVVFDLGRRLVSLRFGALAAALVAMATVPAARYAYSGFIERAITEPFVMPLAAAAAWATVMAFTRGQDRWAFAAGLFIGMAAVYKQTALIYWPALAVWTWFVTDNARAVRFALYAMAGVLVAPLLAFVWLWSHGVLGDAWVTLVEYNVAYLAVGDKGFGFTVNLFAHEVWRRVTGDEVWALGSVSAVVAVCAWRWRSTAPGRAAMLGVLWLAAALTATLANGPRVFTTYFITSLIPLSFLLAWLLDQTLGSGRRWRVAAGLLVLAFAAAMIVRSGSLNRLVSATRWDARHLFGQTDRQDYLKRFRSKSTQAFSAADNERLADYIRAHTEARDRIFVFGMTGGTYFSSDRLPASRFLFVYPAVSNMIDRPEFRVEGLAAELARTSPRYIVLQRHNGDSFSGWRAVDSFAAPPMVALLRNYRQETEIGDFLLYRRNDDRP